MQNFMKLSAAVHELSCAHGKNSDGNNTVRRYRAHSNKDKEEKKNRKNRLTTKLDQFQFVGHGYKSTSCVVR